MSWAAAFIATSIAVLAVALAAQRFVRGAAARHTILLAALLVPPVLLLANSVELRLPVVQHATPAPVAASTDIAMDFAPATPSRLPEILFALWAAGLAFTLLRMAVEALHWRGIARRAELVDDWSILRRFDSTLSLARSREVLEPTVIGIVDPIVVLPAAYELEPAELDAVFAHELAHVRRRDNFVSLVVQLVCAAFWFDPLHRIARRMLVELRERICDALVLDRGCDPSAYATALARSCETSFHSPAVACMSGVNLGERMDSIMASKPRGHRASWLTRSFVTLAVAAVAIAFATFAPAPRVIAGEAGDYDFELRLIPGSDGRHRLMVSIDGADGTLFTSTSSVRSLPDTRTMTTELEGKTFRLMTNMTANSDATGTLEIREGNTVVFTKTKQFEKLATRPMVRERSAHDGTKPPVLVHRVDPNYTAEAKANGIYGIVITEVEITETGDVTNARVLKGLPYGLDQAALDAVRQWKFRPAERDGKAVATTFTLTINFKLE